MATPNITHIPATPWSPAPPLAPAEYTESLRHKHTPIVIDNGASAVRWGFSTSANPETRGSIVSKYRERRTNKPMLLFGDGIELDSTAKASSRTPWESDVLLNFDALEHALDFVFLQLGIDTPTVEHPILMTERMCSPLHSRSLTSELLFELYSVPSVAYCLDGIMSFRENNQNSSDGLVVSFNTSSTSVTPILNGKGIMSQAKRIPWGSSQASEYLLKLIQLKYPTFPTRVTVPQSNWMLQKFCAFSPDYTGHLRSLRSPDKMLSSAAIVQFPFSVTAIEEKTEEELARIAEKRKEQGRKLQEMAAKARMDKILEKENTLQEFQDLKDAKVNYSERDWMRKLNDEGFEDEDELDEAISDLERDVKKARKASEAASVVDEDEEVSFPLLEVPDEELDEEGLKEKRKQRLMKAGYDARVRAREEKAREREEKEQAEREEERERQHDLEAWSQKTRREQERLMLKINDRVKNKAALSDRKSAAAQARMKNIASLASEDKAVKKKRKAGPDDTFGADDADWAIYRNITTADQSDEEEDLLRLQALEQKLLAHDPTFDIEQTHAALASQRSALLSAFRPFYDEGDMEGTTRIHLNTERWRACEPWFSPGMAGIDCAGLGEVIHNILSGFSEHERARLANNVFITGGPSHLNGLATRLYLSMRPNLAPEMPIRVNSAKDPQLDAWRGMATVGRTENIQRISMSKAEYDEHGSERVKRWWGGNWNYSF